MFFSINILGRELLTVVAEARPACDEPEPDAGFICASTLETQIAAAPGEDFTPAGPVFGFGR